MKPTFLAFLLIAGPELYGQIIPTPGGPISPPGESVYELAEVLRTYLIQRQYGDRAANQSVPVLLDGGAVVGPDSLRQIPLEAVSTIAISFDPPPMATVIFGTRARRGTIVITTKKEQEERQKP